jgi:hypothetical protein
VVDELQAMVRAEVQEWSREHRRSWFEGQACAQCGRDFADGETVYVRPAVVPVWDVQAMKTGRASRRGTRAAPHCAGCSSFQIQSIDSWNTPERNRSYGRWAAFPCDGCARPIFGELGFKWKTIKACSQRCRQRVRATARHAARPLRQQEPCTVCGQPFAARGNARTCSSACRQKAYRQRRATGQEQAHRGQD